MSEVEWRWQLSSEKQDVNQPCGPFPGLSSLLWNSSWIHPNWNFYTIAAFVSFSFQLHLHMLLLLPITFGCLLTGCQNHTITQGVLLRKEESKLYGFCHHKKCEWKVIGKRDHISFQSQLTGQTMKTLTTRSFTNTHRHILAFLQSRSLLLSWLPGRVHLGNTQVCPSVVKP